MTRRPLIIATLLCLGAGCGKSSSTGDPGEPTGGVVPADLRDVERAGEGLVSTTFGEAPARQASWDRAAIVLGILKKVWGNTRTATPGLPAAQVTMLDQAIAKLDAAIPARNQKDAVVAANAVGLAVPELFNHFHPDAPIEVIRMDAVFRQVGIDAHFGDWTGVRADVAALKADWNNSKTPVGARVPTCHRVGGTQTVVGEIEDSLKNLDQAVAHSTGALAETESDNGALEIDVLEQLYDCTPDGTMSPANGTGARCMKDSDCQDPQLALVCDLAWASGAGPGKCAPDPRHAAIGTPCTSTVECGTDPRSACNNEAGDGYPGGYCFMEPCDDVAVCPPGATCVAIGSETPGCFRSCKTDADCRQDAVSDITPHGYVCQLFITNAPNGFGPSDHACAFPCTRDEDCKMPLTCDLTSGKCRP